MLGTGSITPNKQPFSRPFILGVAGGSGSGKTYFARALQRSLGAESCEIVYQDNFYVDNSKKFDFDGGSVNFDHPTAIDFSLLAKHIECLKGGKPTEIPIYDFATHSRKTETVSVVAAPVIIVDGILIFHAEEVRPHLDELIFFDTPETLRFDRRLKRDVQERGRSPEGVKSQFLRQVKPMHEEFVDPSKSFATTVVKEVGEFDQVLADYYARLKKWIAEY
jgi:uridine kinase